jgi:ATP-dependent DNA helicase RecG
LFTAIVHRKTIEGSVESSVESSVEIDNPVLEQFRLNPELTLHALAKTLGISLRATEKRVANLQEKNKLKHIGPKKGGYWQVL